jgi:hypothetical protein
MILYALSFVCRVRVSMVCVLLSGFVSVQVNFANADGFQWRLEKQENGVSVYTRQVDDSPYLAAKGTMQINAPVTKMRRFMGDGSSCVPWRAMCKSSQVIEAQSEDDRYVHMVLDLPWPASDRDLILHTTSSIDTESRTATINLQSDSSRHPPQDYVRAESEGQILIVAVDQNTVEFTYTIHTDIGGDLPANLVNKQLVDSTFDDLSHLKELAEGTDHD